MISKSDVVRIKMPYPTVSSKLACSAHMYICSSVSGTVHSFVKCQTLKPYMISSTTFRHFVDELPNIRRNPFVKPTRIDCDKQFASRNVYYDDRLKTALRPNVCSELFATIMQKLAESDCTVIAINERDFLRLNPLIQHI